MTRMFRVTRMTRWSGGMVGAGEMGAVSGYLCIQHMKEVGENRKGWADSKTACATRARGGKGEFDTARGGGRGDGGSRGACRKVDGWWLMVVSQRGVCGSFMQSIILIRLQFLLE